MKTIISEENEIFYSAAEQVKKLLENKPDAVLALSGGRTMQRLYELLLKLHKAGELSFAEAKVFAVTEFADTAYELSSRKIIFNDFLDKTDISKDCKFLPSPERTEEYDELIAHFGGIDLALLGLGENAHIAYNEPATPFSSMTHVQKLTEATKRQLKKQFPSVDRLPDMAVTMGIKTITQARDIIVLALGEEKSQAVHKMLYGRNDSTAPAAFLQIPMNVTVYLDMAASSQL